MGKKKYDVPKREDGRLLHSHGEGAVMEYRGYIDEEGVLEIYTFAISHLGVVSDGERLMGIGPSILKGLREWLKEMG